MEQDDTKTQNETTVKMADLIAKTEASLKKSEELLVKTTETVGEIDTYFGVFNDLRKKLDNPESGAMYTIASLEKAKTDIETVKTSADSNLTQIKDALASVQSNIESMTTAYSDFETIKQKIDNGETGLAAILKQAEKFKTDIETVKTSADSNLTQIKDALASVQSNIESMTTAYSDFETIKQKIDNGETGLAAILKSSKDLKQDIFIIKDQSEGLYKEIKNLNAESIAHHKQIVQLREQSESETNKIKEHEKTSQESKDKIVKLYGIVTGTGLANSFDARKKEIEVSMKSWYNILILTTTLLFASVAAVYITWFQGNFQEISLFLTRLTVTSPLLFFTIFATERYTHERNLLEKYAFKSATAFALESYTTLLKNTFKSQADEQKILDFVLDSMSTIYKEPFDKKTESKKSFSVNSKLGEIKAEVAETKEDIEIIKDMMSKVGKTIEEK